MRGSKRRLNRVTLTIVCFAIPCVVVSLALAKEDGGSAKRSRAACTKAWASLGAKKGVIKFVVHCKGRRGEERVGFSLVRYQLHGPHRGPGILKFNSRPRVAGPGHRRRTGVCALRNTVLGCHSRADGRVSITGRIRVRPGQECAMRIELETLRPDECNKQGECLAVARPKVLFAGRPRGC
jgi:hypothetical protein